MQYYTGIICRNKNSGLIWFDMQYQPCYNQDTSKLRIRADVNYPNLGIILNGLKKQEWFITNLSVWLLCTNEDSDDPSDFEEEDLVEYFGLRVA